MEMKTPRLANNRNSPGSGILPEQKLSIDTRSGEKLLEHAESQKFKTLENSASQFDS